MLYLSHNDNTSNSIGILLSTSTFLTIIFIFQYSSLLTGQYEEKNWEDGKITWGDFKGKEIKLSEFPSKLNYKLTYTTNKKKNGNTLLYFFNTKNLLLPRISWVKENKKSESLLRYNQVIFDLVELERRSLISKLHRLNFLKDADDILNYSNEIITQRIDEFIFESKRGSNIEVIDQWSNNVSNKLLNTPYENLPKTEDDNFGFGLTYGLGTRFLRNEKHNFLSNPFGIIFGWDLEYQNIYLFTNFFLGYNNVKSMYLDLDMNNWNNNLKTSWAGINLSIGHPIYKTSKVRITPFFGIDFSEISVRNNPEKYNSYLITNLEIIYGFYYDLILKNTFNLLPKTYSYRNKNNKTRQESILRLSLFMSNDKSINTGIIFSSFRKKIKFMSSTKKQETHNKN